MKSQFTVSCKWCFHGCGLPGYSSGQWKQKPQSLNGFGSHWKWRKGCTKAVPGSYSPKMCLSQRVPATTAWQRRREKFQLQPFWALGFSKKWCQRAQKAQVFHKEWTPALPTQQCCERTPKSQNSDFKSQILRGLVWEQPWGQKALLAHGIKAPGHPWCQGLGALKLPWEQHKPGPAKPWTQPGLRHRFHTREDHFPEKRCWLLFPLQVQWLESTFRKPGDKLLQ